MSYFNRFPEMIYDISKPGTNEQKIVVTKDIIRRVKLKGGVADNVFAYDPYDIQEGERPDILAHQFYSSSKLAWIILVTNEIHDVYEDWPRTERELKKMINKKYTNPDAEHHKERPQASGDTSVMVKTTANFYDLVTGIGTTQNFASISISNRQYEERENEKKRTIKILRPELIGDFLKEFDEIIGA